MMVEFEIMLYQLELFNKSRLEQDINMNSEEILIIC